MSHRVLRVVGLAFFATGASLVAGVTPAFACHEATGWCCVEHGCCYFENDVIKGCIIFEQ